MVFTWSKPYVKIVSATRPAIMIQDGKTYKDAVPPMIPALAKGVDVSELDTTKADPPLKASKPKKGKK